MGRRKQPVRTLAEAIALLDYKDGALYWNCYRGGKAKKGSRAGSIESDGYRQIRMIIDGTPTWFMEHHIVWFKFKGYLPIDQLDHKNRMRLDNRIDNLREATNSTNQHNATKRRDNTTGFTGVHFREGKYVARISANKVRLELGRFDTVEDAAKAYGNAKKKLHAFQEHTA